MAGTGERGAGDREQHAAGEQCLGRVTRVDPELNAVTATTPRLSVNPIRIAAGAGAVWVADAANDAIKRIDPATGRVVRVIPVGGRPVALAAGDRDVWISVAAV